MLKELESISNKLAECHGVLYRVVGSLSEVGAQTMVTDQWTVKDVLAHLAGAERGMLRTAQVMARGQNPQLPEGFDNDQNNARMVAKRKSQTNAQVLEELRTVHKDMSAFLDSITQEQLTLMGEHPLEGEISLKDMLVVIYSHEATHSNEIQNALRAAKK
jgi:hypothetical protein